MLRPHGPRRRFIHDRQGQSLIRTEPEDGAARVVSVRDDAFREVSIIFGAMRPTRRPRPHRSDGVRRMRARLVRTMLLTFNG